MFSLRDSSGTDGDSFGWWIGAESHPAAAAAGSPCRESEEPVQQPESVSSESTSCAASSRDSGTSSGHYVLQSGLAPEAEHEPAESIELRLLGGADERSAACYTPERLVQNDQFRIRTPSPRFYPRLEELDTAEERLDTGADELKNGAACLIKMFQNPRTTRYSSSARPSRSSRKHCCPIKYGNGEVVLHNEQCPEERNGQALKRASKELFRTFAEYNARTAIDKSRPETDDGRSSRATEPRKIADDSSGISSADALTGTHGDDDDDWSCSSGEFDARASPTKLPSRRVSSELAYVSLEYGAGLAPGEQNSQRSDSNKLDVAIAELTKLTSRNLDIVTARLQSSQRPPSPDPEYLARIALAFEPDVTLPCILILPDVTEAETEQWEDKVSSPSGSTLPNKAEVEAETEQLRKKISSPSSLILPNEARTEVETKRLRDKVDRLQGSNKLLYEEILALKKDFAMDECKVNHLSEDVSKLQTEVHELKYMDGLVLLLKGELNNIPKQNWPFAIRNTKRGTEEINLII